MVVRWRDRRDGTWSDPETAYEDRDRVLTQLRIRVGGPTAALTASFTPPGTIYDDDIPMAELTADDVTAFAVCRHGSCTSAPPYDGLASDPAQVTPNGEHVLLTDLDVGTYVSWHGDDIVEHRPTGLPTGEYGDEQPVLAPDGSLRAVSGVRAPGGCRYTLLTAAPGRTAFTAAARHRGPPGRGGRCAVHLETFSPDYVVASTGPYNAWFLARDHGRWHGVEQDPSGQVRYARPGTPRLAGAYARSGFWHWREVLGSSPDGRTLVVQVHRPGATRWSAPRTVARAPRCVPGDHSLGRPTRGARRTRSTSTSTAGRRPARSTRRRSPRTGGPGTRSSPPPPGSGSGGTCSSAGAPPTAGHPRWDYARSGSRSRQAPSSACSATGASPSAASSPTVPGAS